MNKKAQTQNQQFVIIILFLITLIIAGAMAIEYVKTTFPEISLIFAAAFISSFFFNWGPEKIQFEYGDFKLKAGVTVALFIATILFNPICKLIGLPFHVW